jgi:hypothetical protein
MTITAADRADYAAFKKLHPEKIATLEYVIDRMLIKLISTYSDADRICIQSKKSALASAETATPT